jgi:hypothetical protein
MDSRSYVRNFEQVCNGNNSKQKFGNHGMILSEMVD